MWQLDVGKNLCCVTESPVVTYIKTLSLSMVSTILLLAFARVASVILGDLRILVLSWSV